jgi:hypothetical protein
VKVRLPGAVTSAVVGLTAGVAVAAVAQALDMPDWVVMFGLLPLACALVWLILGVLWRVGRLR